jgi:hypothetical protein
VRTSLYTPNPGNFFFHSKNNPLCKQSKNSPLCSVLFRCQKHLKNVVFTLRHLANQKGKCKKPVLRRSANSLWKPVNIILKLYGEDAYIFYCFRLANPNRFLEFALLHKDVLTPSRTFYLQDLSGSYDITSAINRGSARPLCCVSDQLSKYPHRTRTCYCAVIISSPTTISLKCCEKALKDNRCMGTCIFTTIPISIHLNFFFFLCMYHLTHTTNMYLSNTHTFSSSYLS